LRPLTPTFLLYPSNFLPLLSYLPPGHSATITSATIEDKALVGIGSIVSEGALVETGAQLAAGSVVPPGGRIPAGELWGGNPVKFIRKLEDEEVLANVAAAEAYHALAQSHENEFLPFGAAYLDAEKVKVSK
jgi:carbonic anhydrase/acetyltransferase-like protein (isoleucine patch superfamily)